MTEFEFATISLSRNGRRSRNEDRFAASVDGAFACWALADGLGGHGCGDVAAQTVVDAVVSSVSRAPADATLPGVARSALEAAQSELLAARRSPGIAADMASTIALLLARGRMVTWAHVGDTRIYRLRNGAIERLTRDHSVAEALRGLAQLAGRSAPASDRNALFSVIGSLAPCYDVSDSEELNDGDVFLLASDGLWSAVPDEEVAAELRESESLDDWIDRLNDLVERAADPDQDNFTALAVGVRAA